MELWVTKGKAVYVTGQLEKGEEGTVHIQFFLNFKKPGTTLFFLKKQCSFSHFEQVLKNNGADKYCNKEETRVEGPWSFGIKPVERNSKKDWQEVWDHAKAGNLDEIPADIKIQHYGNIKQIAKDHLSTVSRTTPRECIWYHGESGCGKTRKAVADHPDAYMKLSHKWWDSYRG